MTAPFLHDRWDDQMELEKEMLALGTQRMKDRIEKAKARHDLSNLRPHRSLLHEWVLPVSQELQRWLGSVQRGPKPIALPRLRELEPDTAALVALKCILRMVGFETRGLLAIAVEIGTWCEHEARCKAWKEEEPEDWRLTQQSFRDKHSTSVHQRRATIAIFNKYVRDKLGWIGWTDEERIRVGLEMVNFVVVATGRRFFPMPDPNWVPKKLPSGAYAKRPLVLATDAELTAWIAAAMEDELVHQPAFFPTLIPPMEWSGPRDGGYFTPFVKTPLLIRFKANHQDQKQHAIEEYERLDMPNVYASVNYVQNTPWRINTRVLEVAQEVWDKDLAIAGIPRREAETVPTRPDLEDDDPALKEWAKAASEVHGRNATRVSHYISQWRTLKLAERMSHEPVFYFPHMLDFRGRMYPIPTELSPQGGDLHRGLLTFGIPKPVMAEDAGWLAIHLANCHGVDKVSLDERMAWVEERNDRWRQIAEDPMGNRSWAEEDDAWQLLAAIFEWVRWLDEGEGMLSSLPIRVDGTCNGIQHLSALVRDEVGGAAVNLVPGPKPNDIYRDVAGLLTVELQKDTHNDYAKMWLRLFGGPAPRDVTKRPVMILPYGGTPHAYFTYTMEWLKKNDTQWTIPQEERVKAVSYLVKLLWVAVEGKVRRAKEVMEWLQKCCVEASKQGLPLTWETPAGFRVRQFYGQLEGHRVETKIDGQRLQLQEWRETTKLNTEEAAQGIAPNFIHSLDASALMTTTLLAKDNGVRCMTAIHDAYGTVAGDMWTLTKCLREAFIETHSGPVLENFLRDCQRVAGVDAKWPAPLKMGKLDLEAIRQSDYFFA